MKGLYTMNINVGNTDTVPILTRLGRSNQGAVLIVARRLGEGRGGRGQAVPIEDFFCNLEGVQSGSLAQIV